MILPLGQIEFLLKMLNQGDALPARNATLIRQRIQPAGHVEGVFGVFAPAGNVHVFGCVAVLVHLVPLAVLGAGLVEEGLAMGVDALFGRCGPVNVGRVFVEGEFDGLMEF